MAASLFLVFCYVERVFMNIVEFLKVLVFSLVEGFTEWLPISSTGHLILLQDIIPLGGSKDFFSTFEVLIQLGAVFAVVQEFFFRIWPFGRRKKARGIYLKEDRVILIGKILLACLPAAVLGLLLDDFLDKYLYNGFVVSLMLIVYGVFFLLIEDKNAKRDFQYTKVEDLSWSLCFKIGLFQCLALIPGTSRSGATIIGAMLLSVGRVAATEFSFFLSVPVMAGASLLKRLKHGGHFTGTEWFMLLLSMVLAYLVSIYCIRFLLRYIRNHDFKAFGYYRIVFGSITLLWFLVSHFVL